ncbi:MAG: Npt1/Npt2 family nucleotide transporter [Chlamydiales bacterium]
MSISSPLSKLRLFFWPIRSGELKKFIPMFLMCFFICFIYSLLKVAKDTLVISTSGAEVIPFIKVWAILPGALLITMIFTKLTTRFKSSTIFYIMMGSFLSFFLLFAFVLYPLQDLLHPHSLANYLETILPQGFHGLIAIFRNWTFTLFYVMSELWGTAIMTVLLWGFINQVTRVEEAGRFYGILSVGSNISTALAGYIAMHPPSEPFLQLPFFCQSDSWGNCLMVITLIIALCGMSSIFLFRFLINKVVGESTIHIEAQRKNACCCGVIKSFKYLLKSKYLICIAAIVFMYNISMNMIEIVWKDQVRELYTNRMDFMMYSGKIQIIMGILSSVIAWIACSNVIKRFGWTRSALITPITLLISGSLFFFCFLFKKSSYVSSLSMLLHTTPLALIVFFGALQNWLTRSCKFTFFDATKEMAFIPLSIESKLQGKAAIDGVASRLGKSSGSLIYQFLLMIFGSVATSSPYVGVVLLLSIIIWILATKSLGTKFDELTKPSAPPESEVSSTDDVTTTLITKPVSL